MATILDTIVAQKILEIKELYTRHDLQHLAESVQRLAPETPAFYAGIAAAHTAGQPFFITEFKRKSPSEGWINREADLPAQVRAYAQAGASAISVLTDEPFFGGTYDDLRLAHATLHDPVQALANPPLLLQKDFMLDPIQIYLARQAGADLILLIAAILDAERLDFLKKIAESLGMGVLVEVHDEAELHKINHLDFPVLGVNNRDLKTFRTALNRVNVLAAQAGGRWLVAESGVRDYRDFQMVRNADGFLIGTGLMRDADSTATALQAFFGAKTTLFKACGLRTAAALQTLRAVENAPDFIGINFSPVSKRRMETKELERSEVWKMPEAVAVFYKNTEDEIVAILQQYPFSRVQLYAGDVSPAFVRSLKQRVFLAVAVRETADLAQLDPYLADVDLLILDGAQPGSGQRLGAAIPTDFPYPFLLAGGIHAGNLDLIRPYKNCLGVDVASGIETDGAVDTAKITALQTHLNLLPEG